MSGEALILTDLSSMGSYRLSQYDLQIMGG